jgi:uncharacterized protein
MVNIVQNHRSDFHPTSRRRKDIHSSLLAEQEPFVPTNLTVQFQPTSMRTARRFIRRTGKRSLRAARIGFRVACWAALLLFVAYSSIVVYMLAIEDSLVYRPTRPSQEWYDKPSANMQDVTLHSEDGALHAWYCPVEKPDAVFLMCHGNAGNLSARGQSLPTYCKQFHASFLMFDYPGFGLSDGEPSERGCYAAADAAYDWLIHEKGFKPEQIVIAGESLGGAVAVDLASRRVCSALILTHTFANLPSVAQEHYCWLPAALLMRNRFCSEDKIDRIHVPIFVAHGDCDEVIPLEQAKALFAKVTSAKEFLLQQGKGHFDRLEAPDLDKISNFLARNGVLPSHSHIAQMK